MRVVTFNIHHGTVGRSGPVDPQQLGDVCAGFEADVIALQEVDVATVRVKGRDLAAIAASACGMDHVFGSSQRHLGGRYGNAVLVRGSIVSSRVTRLPKVPRHRFWQEQRTFLEVEAAVDDVAVSIVATHLAVKQWNNGPQLDALLARVADATRPVVVLGDFNRPFGAMESPVADAGLSLVRHGPTYPASAPTRAIDHAAISPEWTVRAAEVRSTSMSDHAALIIDLDLSR